MRRLVIAVFLVVALWPSTVGSATRIFSGSVALSGPIAAGDTVVFDPNRSTTVTVDSRLEVNGGTIQMAPAKACTVVHTLRFTKIDESQYVGSAATDPGLWITGAGRLDLRGSPKLAWTRLSGAVTAGATSIALKETPTGWCVGDEIVITPTLPPTEKGNFFDAYSYGKAVSISGNRVTLDTPLKYDHPAVTVRQGVTMTAEVLNLTRNVRIEGLPGKRAHIHFNMGTVPQTLRYFEGRWLGPQGFRQPIPSGRYGLHFHLMGDASRGTTTEGVVMRNIGNHAFVVHGSHGVTHLYPIAHDTVGEAYWWDKATLSIAQNGPIDLLHDHCVSSKTSYPSDQTLSNFDIGGGLRMVYRDCVAVGMIAHPVTEAGAGNPSGMEWRSGESADSPRQPQLSGWGVAQVIRFVAHNLRGHGWFIWQNTPHRHHVGQGSVFYHLSREGVHHGAYTNAYFYEGMTIYGTLKPGFTLHALGTKPVGITLKDIYIDVAGYHDYAIATDAHRLPTSFPTTLENCDLRGYKKAAIYIGVQGPGGGNPDWLEVRCTFSGNEIWIDSLAHVNTRVYLTIGGERLLLRAKSWTGPGCTLIPKWNAQQCN